MIFSLVFYLSVVTSVYILSLKQKDSHFDAILSLAALEFFKITTSRAASDEYFVKMTTFLFQCTVFPIKYKHNVAVSVCCGHKISLNCFMVDFFKIALLILMQSIAVCQWNYHGGNGETCEKSVKRTHNCWDVINPTDTWRNNDAMITSSLRQNDVGDVVWT